MRLKRRRLRSKAGDLAGVDVLIDRANYVVLCCYFVGGGGDCGAETGGDGGCGRGQIQGHGNINDDDDGADGDDYANIVSDGNLPMPIHC